MKTGETFRGELHEAEDNFNCQLRNVTATSKVRMRQCNLAARHPCSGWPRDAHGQRVHPGEPSQVCQRVPVFSVQPGHRFMVVPDMLKQAPMFKRIDPKVAKQARGGSECMQ